MSQAEDLLNSLTSEEIEKYGRNSDNEGHIVIGIDRNITVPKPLRRIAVQYDNNVETVTFDCPRYWDDTDLSTLYIYINYMTPNRGRGRFLAKNVRVDDEDENMIHFEWTIGKEVTLVNGKINFLVCAVQTDSEGNDEIHWNTEINNEMHVSEGMECVDVIPMQYPDIINDLLTRMDTIIAADTPLLDTSLSQNGLAADAGVTGAALNKKTNYNNNIENMKADSSLKVGDTTITLGYYEANDGGGATYLVRAKESNDVEDGGSIHFLDNGLVAELFVKDHVNVKQFGAYGDGVNDDTNAIQKVFNSTNAIYFDNGTYLLSSNIEITKSCEIIGNNTTIIGYGFQSINNTGLTIIAGNINFKNIVYNAFTVNSSNLIIDTCNFKNIGISDNLEVTYQGAGIYISENFRLTVKNSIFNLCKGHGAIFTNNDGFVDIEYNHFNDNLHRAICLYGDSTSNVVNGEISNNYIVDCGKSNNTGSAVGCNGVYSVTGSQVILRKNTIINSRENGIEGVFKIIDGNIVDGTNVEITTKTTPSVEGIFLSPTHDVIVINNHLKNVKKKGISLYSSEKASNNNILIENNIIDEIEEYANEAYSICFLDEVGISNKTISKNMMKNKIYFKDSIDNNTYIGDISYLNTENCKFNNIISSNLVDSLSHTFKTTIEPFTYSNCSPEIISSDSISKNVVRIDYQQYNRLISPILPNGTINCLSMKVYCRGYGKIELYKNNSYLKGLAVVGSDVFEEIDITSIYIKELKDDVNIWFTANTSSYLEIANVSYNVVYK